jgi:RimJ/RimL family protein N-acetyltransferase
MPFPDLGTQLHLSLDDGTIVLLRPITPDDRPLLEDGLQRLSLRSRVMRFFSAVPHLSERQLDYLTRVDQHDHAAWGAATDDGEIVGLGVGRFVRLPTEPGAAEVAVTVVDEFQGRGLGSLLLALLYRTAQRVEVDRFRAFVRFDNQRLIESLKAIGGTLQHAEEGVVMVDVPVLGDDRLPPGPKSDELKRLLARIDQALSDQRSQNEA